ncbi:MAG TPA: lasso peptide biosynthesis B2 protein [Pyrinomonadaceae bacterium]|nr:lasso peptide biosynthesis B2 protein [Pyrinomonadaceae bacterium]
MKKARLVCRALFEIARYEVVLSLLGSGRILSQLKAQSISTSAGFSAEMERTICDAVLLATCFYWKPVLCLQRAVCTVRLLRKHGIHARLVIGYRPSPFFSHAWVEVDGRVVYGSAAYQKRLMPLHVV